VRGGLQSIPVGQIEAAKALGMNTLLTTALIVLPQALRAVIPATVGQFISLFKDTSLVAIVGLTDLLGAARGVLAKPEFLGRSQEVYVFCALIYWFFNFAMSFASKRLEAALGVGKR
jgi:general L-amino acid transport system permease protein